MAAHAVRGEAATAAYRNTTVINNYAVGANNRVVNHGVARETIAAVSRSPIREVGVRELPAGTAAAVVPDRVTRVGNTTVVYRPGPQISVPHTTPALQQNQVNSTRSTTARTAASTPQSLLPRMAPRPPVPAGSTVSRPMANNTRNYASNRLLIPQPQNSFIAPVAPRSGSMIARPSTPAQSFARPANSSTSYARRSAPTTVTRSAPSGGGMAARGSTSQGSRTVSSSSVAHR